MLKPIRSDASADQERLSTSSGPSVRAEEASILAERLFSFYHDQELASDPEIFLAGVIELFCQYPLPIVTRAVSPVFGIPRKHKFPPRISEIGDWLEAEIAPIRREEERRARRMALPEPEVDRSVRPSYEDLKARYGDNWGLADARRKLGFDWGTVTVKAKAQVSVEDWDKIPNAPRSFNGA